MKFDEHGEQIKPPPFPGVEGTPFADPHDTEHMTQISKLIADLQQIKDSWGDTCVYIRRHGLSWGAVALNYQNDDEKNGVFDLQDQHDRDMLARLEQIERLKADRDSWMEAASLDRSKDKMKAIGWVPLAKALFDTERDPAIKDQAWFDFQGKAQRILAAMNVPATETV